ncbi:hypothetical protein [Caballeronia sp. ATUFL_M1_KS5A]|uniref:CC0125/CC1285 family lipoprotein n=1 Tax=Caballeronia sp. ATUFL_M1_KS5A TaxID=2921778 RepID=UPI002027728C|nr:hypothetical protein [Caballeronia sp. ATUFL_M1_KS5A]
MKTRAILAALGAVVVTMTGCATGYQSQGLTGGFAREVQLDDDTYRVAFNGNGYTSPERAQELMLLRMADVTLSHGHQFFVVLEQNGRIETSSLVTPGFTTVSGSRSGWFAMSTPATVQTFNKPRTYAVFRTFADRPENAKSYNATMLCTSLAAAYQTTCGQVK